MREGVRERKKRGGWEMGELEREEKERERDGNGKRG